VDAPPRLRRTTKIGVLLALFSVGTLGEILDVGAASPPHTKDVQIGQHIQFKSTVRLDASCSGCSHSLPAVADAYLDVEFTPEGTDEFVTLTIQGNAIFIPPASGTLENPKVNTKLIPPSVEAEAKEHNCTNIKGTILDNPFEVDR